MAKRYLNGYKEAAEFSGITWRQLQRLVRQRQISVTRISKNRVSFDPVELEEFRKKRTIRALR
jgi:hypothetical protein